MSDASIRLFHGAKHKLTAPFGQLRDNGTRKHQGTDYGTYQQPLRQYPPLDGGVVNNVVTVEKSGNARGLYVDMQWPHLNLGLILQHASRVMVRAGQRVGKQTPVVETGMTGKNSKGVRVSSGIHAHAELYIISTGKRIDFDRFDFEEVEEVVRKSKVIVMRGGKAQEVEVSMILKDGKNYVELRDLDNKLGLAQVDYDSKKKMPVLTV